MSVIVGLVDGDEVYMMSDRAAGHPDGHWLIDDQASKVWRAGQFLIGVVGRSRVADIITQYIEPEPKVTPYELADMIRAQLREYGALKTQNGVESMDAEVLVAWRGELFHIVANFGIVQPCRYHAIGAGAPYALGSLHATQNSDWLPATRVDMAVAAAAAFSPYVKGLARGFRLLEKDAGEGLLIRSQSA